MRTFIGMGKGLLSLVDVRRWNGLFMSFMGRGSSLTRGTSRKSVYTELMTDGGGVDPPLAMPAGVTVAEAEAANEVVNDEGTTRVPLLREDVPVITPPVEAPAGVEAMTDIDKARWEVSE
eukprot:GHVN01052757.1.p4 GENE.GHVN01052757.1~~GHVN01052757.1.p4  ORF type:complete len:120 (+),score=6.84 GHVN01052757.1:450-809(+)